MSAERKAKSLEYVFADLIDQIRADRQRKQDQWERMGHVPACHNGEWRYEGSIGTLTWEGMDLYHTAKHKADPQIREQISLDDPNPEGHNPVLSEFLAALREDREPECGAEDNLKSMSMVFGAVLSAKEGRRVQLSDL